VTEKDKVEDKTVEEEKEQRAGKGDEQESSDAPDTRDKEEQTAADEETPDAQEPDIETLRQELEETRNQMLRIRADADNFKKRMERDKGKLLKYAGENILRELLTTVDNLNRTLEQGDAEGGEAEQKLEALLAGVELTQKGLHTMLERFDVTPLESVGQPFNPDEMDALTMEASEEVPANHVLTEFAKGFNFKDRVLRHAQVVVSSGSAEKSAEKA
jgi:molecular chaperone GrpE